MFDDVAWGSFFARHFFACSDLLGWQKNGGQKDETTAMQR